MINLLVTAHGQCPYEDCKKTYGSEVSLNLHIKLKHNGGNKTEREKLAVQFLALAIFHHGLPAYMSSPIIGPAPPENSQNKNKNKKIASPNLQTAHTPKLYQLLVGYNI